MNFLVPCEIGLQVTGVSLDAQSDLDVVLAAVGAPSTGKRPNHEFPGVRTVLVRVASLAAAAEMCQFFIKENRLAPGNWVGGEVRSRNGKSIAFVGYTGRVWRLKSPGPYSFQPNSLSEPEPRA